MQMHLSQEGHLAASEAVYKQDGVIRQRSTNKHLFFIKGGQFGL